MAKKIVIASGKGGVGKSTTAAGIYRAFSAKGLKVLAVDADIGLRSLDIILGMQDSVAFDWGDVLLGRCEPRAALIPDGASALLPAPLALHRAFTYQAFRRLIAFLEPGFDYIIIDAPAGVSKGFHLAACACDTAIIVSTPDEICVRSAAAAAAGLEAFRLQDIRLVINRMGKKRVMAGKLLNIDEVIDMTGIRLIGVVPEDPVVAFHTVKGIPVPKDCPAALAFADIAERLAGGNVPLKL